MRYGAGKGGTISSELTLATQPSSMVFKPRVDAAPTLRLGQVMRFRALRAAALSLLMYYQLSCTRLELDNVHCFCSTTLPAYLCSYSKCTLMSAERRRGQDCQGQMCQTTAFVVAENLLLFYRTTYHAEAEAEHIMVITRALYEVQQLHPCWVDCSCSRQGRHLRVNCAIHMVRLLYTQPRPRPPPRGCPITQEHQ